VKRDSNAPRKSSQLSEACHHRLDLYAMAAGAAGVGMLALAQPAPAEVVYTPAHTPIMRQGHILLDLNNDGKADFEIAHRSGCSSSRFCRSTIYLYVLFYGKRTHGNAGIGQSKWPLHLYALKAGAPVSAAQPFGGFYLNARNRTVSSIGICSGSWVNIANRYLGLKFAVNGQFHFGWARLSVSCSIKSPTVAVLTGYAYETVPGKSIRAGQTSGDLPGSGADPANPDDSPPLLTQPEVIEPGSLGVLALGASAIPVWRRKEADLARV
jgi:hypothetical protein